MKKIIAILLLLTISALTLTSCMGNEQLGSGACDYALTRDISDRDVVYVEMCVKNYGKMIILLDRTTAPITVNNFLKLVNDGFYDGLTFHRVMENFMIQGGDPKGDGTGGSEEKIYGEFLENGHYNDIRHYRGVISMARGAYSNDSASSQFFICNADARSSLDGKYAAFGYVIQGMSVVDAITANTAQFGDYNGTIANKSQHAVIRYVKVLDGYSASN